jgi:hypothetical protein
MIEELKELVNVVNSLPQLALWVAIGFWAYKVIIVGSIYGVIRLAINKGYAAWTQPKTSDIKSVIDGVTYYFNKDDVVGQLKRVLANTPDRQDESIKWLSEAITEKIEKDGPPKK